MTTGSCISATGILVESQGAGQAVEIQLTELEVYGTADPEKYPLQKKGLSMEFLRTVAHLRPRTNTFGAVFRIRHNMAMAIHTYFHEHGYFYFHTPLITASDCEGAGEMFTIGTYLKQHIVDLENCTEETLQLAGFGTSAPEAIKNEIQHVHQIVRAMCEKYTHKMKHTKRCAELPEGGVLSCSGRENHCRIRRIYSTDSREYIRL